MPQALIAGIIAGAAYVGAALATGGTITALAFFKVALTTAISTGALLLLAPKPQGSGPRTSLVGNERVSSSIVPAIWHLGEVRASGVLVCYRQSGGTLHMIFVLGQGACEGLTGLYANGEEITMSKTVQTDGVKRYEATSGRVQGGLTIWEFFSADGTQAQVIQDLGGIGEGLDWGTENRLEGVSYVLVKLEQNDFGTDYDARRYQSIPSLEFVLKGLKVSYPDADGNMTTPEWTANAAKIRAWWLINRRGVDQDQINQDYLQAAISKCDEVVDAPTGTGSEYPASWNRYEVNGSFGSESDQARIEEAFDLAMDGSVVEWDGEFLIRPGGDRTAVTTIGEDDILADPRVFPAREWTQKFNRVDAVLVQSSLHDWTPLDIHHVDEAASDRDGRLLPGSSLQFDMVSNSIQAYSTMVGLLREARASLSMEVLLRPRRDWSILTVKPGDHVRVTVSELGMDEKVFHVARSQVNEDWSVSLFLQEFDADRYADSLVLPGLSQRRIEIPASPPPNPTQVDVDVTRSILDSGDVAWAASVSWAAVGFETRARLFRESQFVQEIITDSNQATFNILNSTGEYSVLLNHLSAQTGASLSVSETFTLDSPPLAAPNPIIVRAYGSSLRFVFEIAEREIKGVEIAYQYDSDFGGTAIMPFTSGDYAGLLRLDSNAVLSSDTLQSIVVNSVILGSGRYRFAARFIDTVGVAGAWADLGEYALSLPAADTFSQQSWPQWPGEKTHVAVWSRDAERPYILLASSGSANMVTRRDWAIRPNRYPFGSPATGAQYETQAIDVGQSGNLEVSICPDVAAPDGITPDTTQATVTVLSWAAGGEASPAETIWDGGIISLVNTQFVQVRYAFTGANLDFGLQRLAVNVRLI